MADDLRKAFELVQLLTARYRPTLAPSLPTGRPVFYVVEGCDCAWQAGRFHTHALDPRELTHFLVAHEAPRIVAAYPL